MTGEKNLDALAEKNFMKHWKEVVKELVPTFKQIQSKISDHNVRFPLQWASRCTKVAYDLVLFQRNQVQHECAKSKG